MPRNKPTTVAFKVEAELADLLNRLPNKSAFIRQAITAQFGITCPFCNGKGIVSREIHDHYVRLLEANRMHNCVGCNKALLLPDPAAAFPQDDRDRLEQFFLGGPLYCEPCYKAALPCEDCGWHFDGQRLTDHKKHSHAGENEALKSLRAD